MAHFTSSSVQIEQGWKDALQDEFSKPYFAEIKRLLLEERANGYKIYPEGPLIFNAFNLTPFNKVRVVILGQDPYHGAGQAHGLSFSVPKGVKVPPSLINIFKEITNEFGYAIPQHGNLEHWAKQGVLLLNALLTVRANQPASHHHLGWQYFTNMVIETLSKQKTNLIFMLWGRFAQEKVSLIDSSKHLVLTAAHPSPFSAYNGFFGCNHFKKANDYLIHHQLNAIDWKIE
jgi:uracil-DNA glycosylase